MNRFQARLSSLFDQPFAISRIAVPGPAIRWAALTLLLAAFIGPTVSTSRADEPVTKRGAHKSPHPTSALKPADFATPETTFKTMQNALAKKMFYDFASCFTDEGLSLQAGSMRMIAMMMSSFPSPPGAPAETTKAIDNLKAALKRFAPADSQPEAMTIDATKSNEEQNAALRNSLVASGKAINDRAAFVATVFKALSEADPAQKDNVPLKGAKLVDLKIVGDSATATMSVGLTGGGPEPITFRHVDGQWKVDTLGRIGVNTGGAQ